MFNDVFSCHAFRVEKWHERRTKVNKYILYVNVCSYYVIIVVAASL